MRTIVILGALIISSFVIGQIRTQSEIKTEGDKNVKEVQENQVQRKESPRKVTPESNNVKKESTGKAIAKSNNSNAFGKDKQDASGREFGVSRAAEARLKAKSVKTREAADEMIQVAKKETAASIESIQEKMIKARVTLEERLQKKEITQAIYEAKMKELMEFEKRKNAIILGMI